MKTKQSYIKANTSEVISCCKSTIKSIEESRESSWQKQIADTIESYNSFWVYKILGKKLSTENAVEILKKPDDFGFFSQYQYIMGKHSSQLDLCKKMIHLANKSTDGIVYLTLSDADEINLV